MFFFSNNYSNENSSKDIFSYYVSFIFSYFEKNLATTDNNSSYTYVLNFDNNYYSIVYNNLQKEKILEFRELSYWTKSIIYFYDRLYSLLTFFFRSVQFFIYEVNFTLFYYFFNVFFKFRNTLYYIKLINKI